MSEVSLAVRPLSTEPRHIDFRRVLMLAGVWLHVTECHEHWQAHEPLEHEDLHIHDEHHQHKQCIL